jgi:7-cyano-7-deazaguanine reductase
VLETDLARACGTGVEVTLLEPQYFASLRMEPLPGESLDVLEVAIDAYEPRPDALFATDGSNVIETLRSSLFRSTCPITGQPDYADILVRYAGPRIDHAGLLRYLVSYRRHAGFHEHCVERIFIDISGRCRPQRLTVYARFMRRGGIDINPFRSNFEAAPDNDFRVPRQ